MPIRPGPPDEEARPGVLIAVYTWDLLLALLALLEALGSFGGEATVGQRTVAVGAGEQVLAGLSAASLGALLIIIATLLTRRRRWVREAQIAVFVAAIVLGGVSLLLDALLPGHGVQTPYILTSLLYLIIDALAIVALTGGRVAAWYVERDGRAPWWVTYTLGFWVLSSVALTVLQVLR
ncbi:MAG: hypothetical protein ACYDAC_07945 [Candidatus Dormibacteria bacterium]